MNKTVKNILASYVAKKPVLRTKLSLITDYETQFDLVKETDRSITSSLDLLSEKAESLINDIFDFESLYENIQDLESDAVISYSRLADLLTEVEMKAEELGAAPFEFLPDYNEAVDILDYQYEGKYAEYSTATNNVLNALNLI